MWNSFVSPVLLLQFHQGSLGVNKTSTVLVDPADQKTVPCWPLGTACCEKNLCTRKKGQLAFRAFNSIAQSSFIKWSWLRCYHITLIWSFRRTITSGYIWKADREPYLGSRLAFNVRCQWSPWFFWGRSQSPNQWTLQCCGPSFTYSGKLQVDVLCLDYFHHALGNTSAVDTEWIVLVSTAISYRMAPPLQINSKDRSFLLSCQTTDHEWIRTAEEAGNQ